MGGIADDCPMILSYLKKLNEKAHLTFFLVVLIFAVGFGARVTFLDADPPPFFSHSLEYGDEACKAHNARNFALFGEYIVDEYNESIFSYPCYTIFLSLFLKIFGAHIVAVRFFSIFCCSITFWLIFLIMRWEKFSNTEIIFALLFYWSSSFYLFLNRMGFIEPFLFLWFVLIYIMIYFSLRSAYWAIPAGVFFAAAFFSKAIAVMILPAIAICLLYNMRGLRANPLKGYFYFVLGAAVASAMFYLLVVQIDPHEYVKFNSAVLNTDLFVKSFGQFFPNLLNEYRDIFVLAKFPLTAAFCAAFLLHHLNEDLLKEKSFLIFVMLWFFGALLFLTLLIYRPSRYYLLIVPPACILAGIGAGRFLTKPQRGLSDYLYCITVIIGIIFVCLMSLKGVVTVGETEGISLRLTAELSIVTGLCMWLFIFLFRFRRFLYPIVLAGIIFFLAFNVVVVYRAYSSPRYETARVSGFIRETIGEKKAFIVGNVDEYIFNDGHYNGYAPYWVSKDYRMDTSVWTHIFTDKEDIRWYVLHYQEIMEKAALLGSMETDIMPDGKRHQYYLYEIVR